MEKYFEIFKQCPLFAGIKNSDLKALIDCLKATQRSYKKNEFILSAGEAFRSVGIVLSGDVHILQEDYWGSRTILAHISPGGLFGEVLPCAEVDKSPVSVIAAEEAEVLFINYKRMIKTCSSVCSCHQAIIENMMRLLAQKNIMLLQKMEIVTHRTTRARLLAYLSAQAVKNSKNHFTIPFNRQQLADYLSVERSSMSAELARMQADGLIITNKSDFELIRYK